MRLLIVLTANLCFDFWVDGFNTPDHHFEDVHEDRGEQNAKEEHACLITPFSVLIEISEDHVGVKIDRYESVIQESNFVFSWVLKRLRFDQVNLI